MNRQTKRFPSGESRRDGVQSFLRTRLGCSYSTVAAVFLVGVNVLTGGYGGPLALRADEAASGLVKASSAKSEAPVPASAVNESAREIPVAYDVDVVVVGATTGAVEAARTAARAGAKVFLAAPRPYLGDDMTATLRLWLEEGEVPESELAQRIFTDPRRLSEVRDFNTLSFTYTTDRPSAPLHRDTDPPSKLADGVSANAARDSVQYDGDVTITCDLQRVRPVNAVRLFAFYRGGPPEANPFIVERVDVAVSADGKSWQNVSSAKPRSTTEIDVLRLRIETPARFVRLHVKKSDRCERILLGEIEIIGPPDKDAPPPPAYPSPRPLHVKKVLDDALIEAGVTFLYSCIATDVVVDERGRPCGIVMANRAGRQAVLAKTIIDATDRALVARWAGAKATKFPSGEHTFRRVVIGGQKRRGKNLTVREVGIPYAGTFPNPAKTSSGRFPIFEYTLRLPMKEASMAAWAAADQQARTLTYHPEQQFTSDTLFEVPPDWIRGQESSRGPWPGVDGLPLGAFRPAGVPFVWVLGGCADVSREQAAKLLRPLSLIDLGTRIGQAAAEKAKRRSRPQGARVTGQPTGTPVARGDVREFLVGVRPTQELPKIPQQARAVPVLGRYDVVVVGGGTSGAPAGIAAARQGAKTLVIEYLSGLGGVGTMGAISSYYWGNRVGFTASVDGGNRWVPEQKAEWWRRSLLEAGAEIWFETLGCGAFVEGRQVKGVVVATPWGRGVVLAKVVIDTTGNSDIAAAAGAECLYTDASEFAMQGTGLPPRELGATYTNTDFTIADETDLVDVWHLFAYAKEKYPHAFDQGKLIDTRERRRIVGEFVMTLVDQVNGRTYPDTVVVAYSNFDTHGYTVDPYLELEHPEKVGVRVNVPYRCMLPKGLEGILVGGLGMSAHRDALPLTRMQADLQNQGYALGVAAAMAVRDGVNPRDVNVRELQKHLVEIGNLPESVLTDKDSYPMPIERIREAVRTVKDDFKGAAVLFAQPNDALPLLRKAYAEAEGQDKLAYAHVLAVMGDPTGVDTLIAEVEEYKEWDEGWDYRAMGQFGRSLSRLDRLIIALGRAGDRKALPAILKKLKLLTAKHAFSHHRAVGLALELLHDPAAAKPLAEVLARPDMQGHVIDSIQKAKTLAQQAQSLNDVSTRRNSLRELVLARALFRCGDYNGVGRKILEAYTHDLRGHLARHAYAVLKAGPSAPAR